MKHTGIRAVSLLLTAALCCLCLSAAFAETPELPARASAVLYAAAADAVPAFQWQKQAAFPDWKGYTDDTLAMNSMLSFQFWHGQSTLWLSVSEEVESFVLYVNGVLCDTSAVRTGAWSVDISGVALDGVNTLQVSNILPLGLKEAVTVFVPYPEILSGGDSLGGIRPEALRLISDTVASDVEHGFPGAQLAVIRSGRLVCQKSWGTVSTYKPDGTPETGSAPVTADTMYDLASVTKMFSANYAVQKLVTEKRLDVDMPLVEILGGSFADDTLDFAYSGIEDPPDIETQKEWKRRITVRDLLCHQAGFPAGPRYFDLDYDMSLQASGAPGSNRCFTAGRGDTLKSIFRTPLLYEPRSRTLYSDVDYMLLAFVTEQVTGMRLDEYMKETFFTPLGLEHITFLPLENGFSADDCAATELNGNTRDGSVSWPGIRTYTLRGEVHDENAWYSMGGVSGHAGLFASATDLAKLASLMLTGGSGGLRFFSRDVLDLFTAPKSLDFGQWGLGWYREGDDRRIWYFGTQSSSDTVGHQGWTGTLVMVDPSRDLVVVYLTNKINTPVTDPAANPNGFDGNCYTASTLGFVPQILSIGMDSDSDVSAQLLDLAADMASESLKRIPEGAGVDHPYTENARSRINVLRKWASEFESQEYLRFADTVESMLPH